MESYLGNFETTPPKIDEFELTFFGPGFGESIVVYIPGIGWGVIDSCEFGETNQKFVPPLEYLISQNVSNIAFLILTHPHMDHIKGMQQIINHYIGKINRICRYSGDGVRELSSYLHNRGIKGITQGARILASVLKEFKRAGDNGAERIRLGARTQVIPRQPALVNGKTVEVEVLSLSPLAEDEDAYINILRESFPTTNEELKEIPDDKHNLIASAIWISVGKVVAILGSDVEKGSTRTSGWRGIVRSIDAPDLCVKALKVPHHGSPNAHYKKAWKEHCRDGKILSVIAPFNKGSQRRPSEDDIQRIGKYSKYIGLTSRISYKRALEVYDRAVARRLPEKWKVVEPSKECGMITIRYDLEGNKTLQKAIPPADVIRPAN